LSRTKGINGSGKERNQIAIDVPPDTPVNFGYKTSWLAIKTEDSSAVLDLVPIDNTQPANWHSGIEAAYKTHLFVSPPINGWTFLVGSNFAHEEDLSGELSSLLCALSVRFGEAQYFGTHRVVEYHAWARYVNGQETRAFAYLGERGEYLADRGDKTGSELELGYDYFHPDHPDAKTDEYWDREDLLHVDEDHVMELAEKWSLNPLTLDSFSMNEGVGWIGQYRKR